MGRSAPEPPKVNKGGRPKKTKPQDTTEGQELAAKIAEIEADALKAGDKFHNVPTMANKTLALAAELRAAMLQRRWCLLAGDHTHALRWAEIVAKLSREHAAAAEADAIDKAAALAKRAQRERAVSHKIGR